MRHDQPQHPSKEIISATPKVGETIYCRKDNFLAMSYKQKKSQTKPVIMLSKFDGTHVDDSKYDVALSSYVMTHKMTINQYLLLQIVTITYGRLLQIVTTNIWEGLTSVTKFCMSI